MISNYEKMKKYILQIAGIGLLFSACKTNLEPQLISSGEANFSRFVAVGNSLASGYSDGALTLEGQKNSYPKMLAEQFALAGGGVFKVPYMNEGGGNDGSNNAGRVLGFVTPCNSSIPSLSPILNPKGFTPLNNVAAQGPYNLVAVPGIRAIDANWNLYSLLNPFLNRFVQTPGTSTLLSEAMRINPTFFTLWLGNNDVLGYATEGAPAASANPLVPAISDDVAVKVALTTFVDSLTKFGAKGAIANVPDVTSVPYFTTVPWNSVILTQGKADTLNQLYASLSLPITWTAGANGLLIVDSTQPGFLRKAIDKDLILLTTPGDSIRCGGWGVLPDKPLIDRYVLDKDEVTLVQLATSNYNKSIAELAAAKNLALVDMNAYMRTITSGIVYNGITMNAKFISGGAFSLDGVHPNPRGYALIANEFIRSINAKYKSSIPYVELTKYKGVLFP